MSSTEQELLFSIFMIKHEDKLMQHNMDITCYRHTVLLSVN